jgi:hypothetical protein
MFEQAASEIAGFADINQLTESLQLVYPTLRGNIRLDVLGRGPTPFLANRHTSPYASGW